MDKFNFFPAGKERKRVVQENKKRIKSFEDKGKERMQNGFYSWMDSPLDRGQYGGTSFFDSFSNVLPEGEISLKNYIETILSEKKGKAIGIEFGGIGINAFSGFTPGFFKKSIGLTLVDHRDEEQKSRDLSNLLNRNSQLTHEVLKGDIFSSDSYIALDKILQGGKVDFIIERMGGGLDFVPIEPFTVSRVLETWYELLSEVGVMFIQAPIVFDKLLEDWASRMQKEFGDKLEIQYKTGDIKMGHFFSSFRIRKLPGAPSKLPLLKPKVVKNTRQRF